jgi:hypothetical protein
LRPNKPPGGHQALPRQPPPQKNLAAPSPRYWRAAGSIPLAARAAPAGGFPPQIRAACTGGDIDTSRRTPSFFLASFCKLRQAFQKHGSIFSPHWPVDFCAPKRLVFVSRPAALGFAACGTCLSPAPALVWLLNYLCLSSFCSPVALVLPVCK